MNVNSKSRINCREAIRRSALWAAYGDAVGFISELSDEKKLLWRASTSRIITTIPWKRKIGGQFGGNNRIAGWVLFRRYPVTSCNLSSYSGRW